VFVGVVRVPPHLYHRLPMSDFVHSPPAHPVQPPGRRQPPVDDVIAAAAEARMPRSP